ncbi:MAG TPA: bifunctional enoyl-CoA hydratase/phosphate acetyltransferase [Firmicutes bacterium]|nr:bifunctional enoyl-CoA hydratase/phosphate acetyltransferase [Candidatus Fermentithermobacillaceae bacterium]
MVALFESLLSKVKSEGPVGVSLVQAQDPESLSALAAAEEEGFARPFLVGDRADIEKVLEESRISFRDPVFVDASDQEESVRAGVSLVRDGSCGILMKGKVPTPTLLRAVLDKEKGLRKGSLMSHVACLEVPGYDRFIFVTDGGVNLMPDLDKKVEIAKNAIAVAKMMGVRTPRLACLGPTEVPTLDSDASVHGAILAKMADRGAFPGAYVDGPMALDVAVSAESASIKGVGGEVAGKADILLAPDLVSGNSVAKSMQYFAKAVLAGVIVGASAPLVVISRADTKPSKLYSLAMARILITRT